MPMLRDTRGLEVSTRNPRSLEAYERASDELHRTPYTARRSSGSTVTGSWLNTRGGLSGLVR